MTTAALPISRAASAASNGAAPSPDVWAKLAAPVPADAIQWRQDGKVFNRDGKYFARFVAFIEAGTVRERLDTVVPGEWDLTIEPLPNPTRAAGGVFGDVDLETICSCKARLQILGTIREDIGHGRDWKQASTDAFKRAAVRFGIGHELYAYEQNWVQVDGDSRSAKPLEDPQAAYDRRYNRAPGVTQAAAAVNAQGATRRQPNREWLLQQIQTPGALTSAEAEYITRVLGQEGLGDAEFVGLVQKTKEAQASRAASSNGNGASAPSAAPASSEPTCPKCSGRMWDNRATKRNPKAPDFKCRDRSCDGVIWPPKEGEQGNGSAAPTPRPAPRPTAVDDDFPAALTDDLDDGLPF